MDWAIPLLSLSSRIAALVRLLPRCGGGDRLPAWRHKVWPLRHLGGSMRQSIWRPTAGTGSRRQRAAACPRSRTRRGGIRAETPIDGLAAQARRERRHSPSMLPSRAGSNAAQHTNCATGPPSSPSSDWVHLIESVAILAANLTIMRRGRANSTSSEHIAGGIERPGATAIC
jgi:hypothetical protein